CTYCHDWRLGRDQTMTFEVMAHTIARALQDPVHTAVDFIWHGGETTVLPIDFYRKAVMLQTRFRRPNQAIRNIIQTNGTRITPEWVRFFRRYGFEVGVSLDGPPPLNDQYRLYASGRSSSPAIMRGMRLLREGDVPFDVLMVVDRAAIELGAAAIFAFFLE